MEETSPSSFHRSIEQNKHSNENDIENDNENENHNDDDIQPQSPDAAAEEQRRKQHQQQANNEQPIVRDHIITIHKIPESQFSPPTLGCHSCVFIDQWLGSPCQKILLIGGMNEEKVNGQIWLYDIIQQKWEQIKTQGFNAPVRKTQNEKN